MGFFDKILGSKPKQETRQLKLEEVNGFVQGYAADKKKNLEDFNAKKFSELKHVLREAESMLRDLDSQEIESENPKLKKIAQTTKAQMSKQLSSLVKRLSPPSFEDLTAVRDYIIESGQLLNREIPTFGKNIAYTSIVLKDSVKKIGALLGELQKIFTDLEKVFSENKAVFLQQSTIEKIQEIKEHNKKISGLTASVDSMSGEISSIEKLVEDATKQLSELQDSPEAKKLSVLQKEKSILLEKKNSLEQDIFEKTSLLEKPLKKLSNLAENQKTGLSKTQAQFLKDFLRSPLPALKSDPKADYFKAVLKELETQFSIGTIDLKEKDLEKKQAGLQELLKLDFFETFFWKSNELASRTCSM